MQTQPTPSKLLLSTIASFNLDLSTKDEYVRNLWS